MAKINQPIPGAVTFDTQISRDSSSQGIINSQILQGGYQEVSTIQDRNDITIFETGAVYDGFTQTGDANNGISTGSRQIGMLVFVIEDQKFYQLMPEGFFGNGGTNDFTIWNDLSQAEKAVRMKPDETLKLVAGDPFAGTNDEFVDCASLEISCDAASVWVEVSLAGPQGEKGADGQKGQIGEGAKGNDGQKGETGEGAKGNDGQKGEIGVGQKGNDGEKGADGSSGQKGAKGDDGQKGEIGQKGQTDEGAKGNDGQKGADGQKGETGQKGNEGDTSVSGSGENIFAFSQGASFYKVGQDSEYENVLSNENPDLYVNKGLTYTFKNNSSGNQPITIFSESSILAAGIVSGSLPIAPGGVLVWKVPQDAYGTYTYLSTESDKLQGTIIVCCADGYSEPTPTPTPTPTRTVTGTGTPEYTYWRAEHCSTGNVIDIRTQDDKVGLTKFAVKVKIDNNIGCYEIEAGGSPNTNDIEDAYENCTSCIQSYQ